MRSAFATYCSGHSCYGLPSEQRNQRERQVDSQQHGQHRRERPCLDLLVRRNHLLNALRRIFENRLGRVEVVAGRNHRKEQDQHANQAQQRFRVWNLRKLRRSLAFPREHAESGERHRNPQQIEQQFHAIRPRIV